MEQSPVEAEAQDPFDCIKLIDLDHRKHCELDLFRLMVDVDLYTPIDSDQPDIK